jgi:hypothetical protein
MSPSGFVLLICRDTTVIFVKANLGRRLFAGRGFVPPVREPEFHLECPSHLFVCLTVLEQKK